MRFASESCRRLLLALTGLQPRHRMRPDRLPLSTDPTALVGSRNLYVACALGVVDFLGEVTGVGSFDVVRRDAVGAQVGAVTVNFMSLEQLLTSKRALARPKDLRVVQELELIRGKRGR
ncbi:MAG: hypothetical protein IPJ65_25855 [Archangiaceae bacterium]|nr:hypothetical protein [Archangiaceae bacterium]